MQWIKSVWRVWLWRWISKKHFIPWFLLKVLLASGFNEFFVCGWTREILYLTRLYILIYILFKDKFFWTLGWGISLSFANTHQFRNLSLYCTFGQIACFISTFNYGGGVFSFPLVPPFFVAWFHPFTPKHDLKNLLGGLLPPRALFLDPLSIFGVFRHPSLLNQPLIASSSEMQLLLLWLWILWKWNYLDLSINTNFWPITSSLCMPPWTLCLCTPSGSSHATCVRKYTNWTLDEACTRFFPFMRL